VLAARLFSRTLVAGATRAIPQRLVIHQALKRAGMKLQMVLLEYLEAHRSMTVNRSAIRSPTFVFSPEAGRRTCGDSALAGAGGSVCAAHPPR